MSLQLIWSPRSRKDLLKLDGQVRARVVSTVERFAATGSGDVLQLTDVHPPEWRLRVGDWRVRFRLDSGGNRIEVLRVVRRDKAY